MVQRPAPLRLVTTPGSPHPIYRQLVDQIRAAISRGQLAPGDGLPSVRAVAEDLLVNANTVAKAYGELVRAGDVLSEPGRGLFVAPSRPQTSSSERRRRLRIVAARLVAEAVAVGATREELEEIVDECCSSQRVLARGGRHGAGRESA